MEYKIITPDRFEEVKKHLNDHFLKDEPLCKALGLYNDSDKQKKIADYAQKTLEKNLSIMAVNEKNEIVGVRLNDIDRREDLASAEDKTEKSGHIFRLLIELNKRANIFAKFNVDEVFALRMLSVDARYRGKGIGKEMITHTEKLARERGFKLMKVEATGIYSQNVLKSKGFVPSEEIYYDKWCDESGEPIFKVDPPHVKVQFLYKELK